MFDSIRNKVITAGRLKEIRQNSQNKKIVFCSGCYDILQSGHAVFFSQCRQFGDILVVGVGRDEIISRLKGPGRPVNPENNRLYLVASLQDVDYAVLNDSQLSAGKIDFQEVMQELHPDVFVLNSDDTGIEEKKELCDRLGTKMEFVQRIVPPELELTSTTRIIDKINFAYRAPLRIDFAGGWTDVPFIMGSNLGYVSNITISPLIELKNGKFNFSGYPRGSGLSTSTAVKLLEMISSKAYNSDSKTLAHIGEDLFNLENTELNWAIGRQDQYSIVYGGFNCFEFGQTSQSAVEQVYQNHKTPAGQDALGKLSSYGREFALSMQKKDFIRCAEIMELNFKAQMQLASASTNEYLDTMYAVAQKNGLVGGKIAGAGGGGAFILYCEDTERLKIAMKKEFVDCFEIDFDFHYKDIKRLNKV
ncbi:MAG: ADP-heptose synthase, D-beta-D-heptose 7-phosphate kinase / D-beta-D-heptose 1-phosphate [Bacteroidetes bacterium]|nr:ADP-heptose synthase, D-beta-D-heptose 7-phosphate kinase / D-beta-D-heptose 1-phosphate [Bacteroidota bacterium]